MCWFGCHVRPKWLVTMVKHRHNMSTCLRFVSVQPEFVKLRDVTCFDRMLTYSFMAVRFKMLTCFLIGTHPMHWQHLKSRILEHLETIEHLQQVLLILIALKNLTGSGKTDIIIPPLRRDWKVWKAALCCRNRTFKRSSGILEPNAKCFLWCCLVIQNLILV